VVAVGVAVAVGDAMPMPQMPTASTTDEKTVAAKTPDDVSLIYIGIHIMYVIYVIVPNNL